MEPYASLDEVKEGGHEKKTVDDSFPGAWMSSRKTVICRIIVAICVSMIVNIAIITMSAIVLWANTNTLPTYVGTLHFDVLQKGVEISREDNGVVHIHATSIYDAFFGQAYAQAQDRIFQMELRRRLGKGTLSEVLGDGYLEMDKLMRSLGLVALAKRSYEALPQEFKDELDAFAAGVNAYIETNSGNLPYDFTYLNFKPSKWNPEDSILALLSLSWYEMCVMFMIL